jgi:hypothetical protein
VRAQSSSFALQVERCEKAADLSVRYPLLSSAVPQVPPSCGPSTAHPARNGSFEPRSVADSLSNVCSIAWSVGTRHDLDVGRPIAAPLEQCAELLGVDLATVRELAAKVEPYVRADGTRIWSLMQLERELRPEAYGRRRGGYLDRRRSQIRHA